VRLRQQLFRFVQQQKTSYYEEQELLRNRQLISLCYLYDWGTRYQFNAQFYKIWSEIINQDPKFKSYGFKIILKAKHCYSSYVLLAQQYINQS